MRRFLLIFACALSFCVHAQTNVVELTQEQWDIILGWTIDNSIWSTTYGGWSTLNSDGSVSSLDGDTSFFQSQYDIYWNLKQILSMLHLIIDGTLDSSYNTADNNILAYASSLRQHNADILEVISDNLEPEVNSIWKDLGRYHLANTALFNAFRGDYSNGVDRLYEAITNLDFNVSISNQIELIDAITSDNSPLFSKLENIRSILFSMMTADQTFPVRQTLDNNHRELMDFLHSLSNTAFFASNLCNCCFDINSNYQDSVVAMLAWMTNQWSELAAGDPTTGFDKSNSVWSVWIPSDETWPDLAIPALTWGRNDNQLGFYPRYLGPDDQYDGNFKSIARQYYDLLKNYEAGDIDGQRFFAGLVDLQLHIMANMSTQLYMIDLKMPTKTNLWEWIEQYKTEVQERVQEAQAENSEAVSAATALLDYTPFASVGGHFPKVSATLEKLRVDSGAPTVVRLPIPAALRHSDSDELVVDLGEKEWYSTGKAWCRWIFTFIWGWLFIRLGIVPIFYIFFFGLRVAEISAHMVFLGSVRGSSGIVSSIGASAVDMVLSLLGIDTDFKRFVWGIMRD